MAEIQSQDAVVISIRARQRQRDLIDRAAERQGRSRSEFMMDASCREAENVLLDQTFFVVDDAVFRKFEDLVDNPPEPSERLRRFLLGKTPRGKE